jgi:SAM-dependent methyltransferase
MSEGLPLADATLDRITARNTIIYVRNPVATFEEFRRVLKPGGLAHAIESDWSLTAVEPLGSEWRALVGAASWAWRIPEIGRQLYGFVRRAGFSKVAIQVLTKPDTEGRLLGMIKTVAGYAVKSGSLDASRIDAMLQTRLYWIYRTYFKREEQAGLDLPVGPSPMASCRWARPCLIRRTCFDGDLFVVGPLNS